MVSIMEMPTKSTGSSKSIASTFSSMKSTSTSGGQRGGEDHRPVGRQVKLGLPVSLGHLG